MATSVMAPAMAFGVHPMMAPPAPAPAPAAPRAELATLKDMFPDVDAEVLDAILGTFNGDVERAVATLLSDADATATADDTDAALARRVQADIDAEVARGLHDAIQEELKANEPSTRVSAAVSASVHTMADSTRKLLQRIRPLSARKSGSSHSTRLLDSTAEPSDAHLEPIASPLNAPLSAPLHAPLYTPPAPVAPPRDAASPPPPPAEAPVATAPLAAPTDLYSSRVGRARAANRSRSSVDVTAPAAAAAAAAATVAAPPEVPVGDLI